MSGRRLQRAGLWVVLIVVGMVPAITASLSASHLRIRSIDIASFYAYIDEKKVFRELFFVVIVAVVSSIIETSDYLSSDKTKSIRMRNLISSVFLFNVLILVFSVIVFCTLPVHEEIGGEIIEFITRTSYPVLVVTFLATVVTTELDMPVSESG